jgi:hypothetical protein
MGHVTLVNITGCRSRPCSSSHDLACPQRSRPRSHGKPGAVRRDFAWMRFRLGKCTAVCAGLWSDVAVEFQITMLPDLGK